MLNQWQWKKAIASIISALILLVSTGGLVSCGNSTQEPESQDNEIEQNNNQRTNQEGNNQRNESDNEQNEEQDDDDNDEEQDGDDNN